MTALMYAASCGHKKRSQLLIDAGASLSLRNANTGMSALAYALSNNHTGVVSALINAGAQLDLSNVGAQDVWKIEGSWIDLMLSKDLGISRQSAVQIAYSITQGLHELREDDEPLAMLSRKRVQDLRMAANVARYKVRMERQKKVAFATSRPHGVTVKKMRVRVSSHDEDIAVVFTPEAARD